MRRMYTPAAGAVMLALSALPVAAHHPLGGMPMTGFRDGVLSGLGHPVLGFDHLFFVLAAGLTAGLAGLRFTAPLAYLAAMLAGCLVQYGGSALPLREAVIALSLVAIGAVLLRGRAPRRSALLALFAGFGLFHGAGFGTSIAAQEAGVSGPVLAGYLLGLLAVQYALALLASMLGHRAVAADGAPLWPRLAGAAVAGMGLLMMLEQAEGAVLAAWLAG